MELALECEWDRNRKEIKHDFEKLLFVRAAMKVFICSPGSRLFKATIGIVEDAVKSHRLAVEDDEYGLVVFHSGTAVHNARTVPVQGFIATGSSGKLRLVRREEYPDTFRRAFEPVGIGQQGHR